MTDITIEKQTEIENNEFEIAKKRYRIGAFLIDFFIFWLIAMVLGFFFGEPLENEVGFHMTGLPAFGMMLFGILLWPMSEGIWGQTIGKRILDIKVVTNEFKPIGIGQAFGRFFLGFIDYIFVIGLIIASTNKQNKRIGDMVANTIVIRTKKPTHNTVYN
ncbi:RDD family protein [Lacinutrix algicola]|uniref:RDD family protein n=1 Tax=Lacinutrix algicola TaxID=342954 RepID=UPI0006E31B31|nr:RDD family protein [Lacinutrix algicola]